MKKAIVILRAMAIALCMTALSLTACDNDTGSGGGGGTPTTPPPLTATVGGKTVTGQSGVTTQQFNTAVANLNSAYGHLGDAHKTNWNTKITSIQIVSGSTVVLEGKVLKVGAGASDETILEYIVPIVASTTLIQPKTARGVILT